MRIAHFSDTHLGRTSYTKVTPSGTNQREFDLMYTFGRVLDAIEAQDPDLVVHAGDFFEKARPSNWSVIHAFRRLSKFQSARNGRPFVIVGGNHDSPQTADSEHILRLFEEIPGMVLSPRKLLSKEFVDLDLELLLVPSDAVRGQAENILSPSTGAKTKVMVLHGMAKGVLGQNDPGEFDPDETYPDRWDYVALGDFHVAKNLRPNVRYCGSTDLATTNIWEELAVPKSWTLFDTESRTVEEHPITIRPAFDLPKIDAANMDASALQTALLDNAQWPEGDDPIVRQVVINVDAEVRRNLDLGVVRAIQERCLHYQYVPQSARVEGSTGTGSGNRAATLEEEWASHIQRADLPLGMDRDTVVDTGVQLLKEVAVDEADPS